MKKILIIITLIFITSCSWNENLSERQENIKNNNIIEDNKDFIILDEVIEFKNIDNEPNL